ncbi:MAG: hypothetical protein AAF627_09895 [Myxococcota bacterium]
MATQPFDGDEALWHLGVLGHPAGTLVEIFGLPPEGGPPIVGFFDDTAALCREVEALAGKLNLYVGVQPRDRTVLELTNVQLNSMGRSQRASSTHIPMVTGFLLDLDTETSERREAANRNEKKGKSRKAPSTDQELERTLQIATELIEHHEWRCTLFSSGNGAQILIHAPVAGLVEPRSVEPPTSAVRTATSAASCVRTAGCTGEAR